MWLKSRRIKKMDDHFQRPHGLFYQPQQNGNDVRKRRLILALTPKKLRSFDENWKLNDYKPDQYPIVYYWINCRVKYCNIVQTFYGIPPLLIHIMCASLSIVQIFTALVWNEFFLQLLWLAGRNGFSTCYIPLFIMHLYLSFGII